MPKEVKRDTIARKSAFRPSVLKIAINLVLVGCEEPINATLKPPEL